MALIPRSAHLWLARALAPPIARWYQRGAFAKFSAPLWQHVCERRINHYGLEFLARTPQGVSLFCRTNDLIQSRIFYFGVWEPDLTAFFRRRFQPGRTFIDIGANIGYYSLLAAKAGMEVVSIEASSTIYRQLQRNIERNELSGIRAIHVAVGRGDGQARLYPGPQWNAGASSLVEDFSVHDESSSEIVPVKSLFDITEPRELAQTRLIKIDVEGSEAPVLIDILDHSDALPLDVEIVAEISPQPASRYGISVDDLFRSFSARGFNAYSIRNTYDMESYLPPQRPVEAPRRLRVPHTGQVDVIFSRANQERL